MDDRNDMQMGFREVPEKQFDGKSLPISKRLSISGPNDKETILISLLDSLVSEVLVLPCKFALRCQGSIEGHLLID
jgi:hypothetical protein